MKKESLIDLLQAESCKGVALLGMQVEIEDGDFVGAMEMQFEYLYWHDECVRLHQVGELSGDRWRLVLRAHGV